MKLVYLIVVGLIAVGVLGYGVSPRVSHTEIEANDDHYVVPEDHAVSFHVLRNDELLEGARITEVNGKKVQVGDVIELNRGAKLTVLSDGRVRLSD